MGFFIRFERKETLGAKELGDLLRRLRKYGVFAVGTPRTVLYLVKSTNELLVMEFTHTIKREETHLTKEVGSDLTEAIKDTEDFIRGFLRKLEALESYTAVTRVWVCEDAPPYDTFMRVGADYVEYSVHIHYSAVISDYLRTDSLSILKDVSKYVVLKLKKVCPT